MHETIHYVPDAHTFQSQQSQEDWDPLDTGNIKRINAIEDALSTLFIDGNDTDIFLPGYQSGAALEASAWTADNEEKIEDAAEERIFGLFPVDDETRKALNIKAMQTAREYWKDMLQQPSVTLEDIRFATKRIAHLTSRLHQLGISELTNTIAA